MTISNFPNGFNDGVTIRGVPVLSAHGPSSRIFWVDSGHANASNANDGTVQRPLSSIEGAFNHTGLTANNGDIIFVAPGHTETVSAIGGLDMDVAGVTVWFLGNGNDRGRINFTTAVGADMDVDAADITMVNPRFTAGIDALTGPIDVNSARFRIFNGTWIDGTTINTTDCVVADANADNMVIDGFEFVDGDAAGTTKQSFIQVAAATGVVIKNVKCTGTFATGIIENGTAWVDALLENCVLDNANVGPTVCLLLQGTSTGWVKECHFRVASGTTYVTADNDMQFAESFGYSTDASAGEKVGTILAGDLEAKIDVIDAFHDVPTADVVTNSQMRDVVGNKTDAAAAGAVSATESLMAYAKQIVGQLGTDADTNAIGAVLTGAAGVATFPAAAHPTDAVNLAEVMRSIWARNIAGINPLGTVVFVAASGGDDGNAGTSPNAPKATIASAITAAGAGGTIVLGPGTHNVDVSAAALTPLANQQFISAIPCFGGAPRAVIANDADDGANIVVVDVDGTVWRDIEFRNAVAATTCVTQFSVAQTTAVRGIHFENCTFNQGGFDGAMISVAMNDATNAVTGAAFKNCRFTGATGTTAVVVYIQVGIGGIARSLIEGCVFECQSADGDARALDFLDPGPGGTTSYSLTIRNNDFVGPTDGGNDAVPIAVAAAMTRDEIIPAIRGNFFHQCSTTPVTQDKFNESIINNYVGDSATGGTLVDPGT